MSNKKETQTQKLTLKLLNILKGESLKDKVILVVIFAIIFSLIFILAKQYFLK